jgi:hypothetical protein
MKQIQSKKTVKQLFLLLSLFSFSISQGYSQSAWASKVSALPMLAQVRLVVSWML